MDEDEFTKSALQVNHALAYYQRGNRDPFRNFLNIVVYKKKLIKGVEAEEVPEVPEVVPDKAPSVNRVAAVWTTIYPVPRQSGR